MIKNVTVCDVGDILHFGVKEKIGHWNELHDLLFKEEEGKDWRWYEDVLMITSNFFNPEYMDDAYGLSWHPKVQELIKGFMKENQIDKLVVVITKRSCLIDL